MALRLENKIALITGGASGIGRATAIRFAEEGANIAVADRAIGGAEEVAAHVRKLGRKAIAIQVDTSDEAQVDAMVEVLRANGLAAPAIRARAPFDLVFANILLAPLQRLAAPLTGIIAPGGCVVLSGLLASQANAARAAYHGLRLERRITLDGWTTLVLRRASAC